jgi:hypothetical protein
MTVKSKATLRRSESATADAEADPRGAATGSARLTARLRGDEMDALVAFAKAHHWTATTAIRAILREKFLGERIPF